MAIELPQLGDLWRRRRAGVAGSEPAPRSENGRRHRAADGGERSPRPIGVAAGSAWEPREPTRSLAGHTLTYKFLELLESAPWVQDVAVAALAVLNPLATRGDAPLPPDVADPPGSWKFAAIGDYGAGTVHLTRVARNLAASGAELVVTAGDNVYPTGRWQDYRRNWEPAMGPVARSRAFMPALGNHDMYRDDLRPFFGHFPHLQGKAYYTFTRRDAQFYALDSDQDLRAGSAQRAWLDRQLAASTSRWKVVYLHYPMYGSSLEAFDEIRESLQPLLERHGVQLVIAGHEHNYLRAKPVGGVTHVLSGGGGQRVYPFGGPQPAHLARRAAAYHHLEVSVGAAQMVVRAIDEHGRRIDTVVIPPGPAAQARAGAAALGRRRRAAAAEHAVSPSPAAQPV